MIGAGRPVSKRGVAGCGCHDAPPISCTSVANAYIEVGQACHLASASCFPKIEFRKTRCADSNCYSVLCAS
ncbi:hypothetical protein ELI38_15370 [Rhizobium leguminosarum]|nr:hypothetical protein [Rhizobium leguminosarum bv. viciae]TAU21683.1 hypothetical protein ELI50_14340 [Rhizobium leguminosarum]NKK00025.1 hypothetical protein [Rhizobium leguminosarum bv. viciae]NKK82956.1 hypothetical protein [Rhizobium leguminosarum bv. viciae]NKK91215.1 hypothetical protein [Rhizobium leguminosarum bv. viciae]